MDNARTILFLALCCAHCCFWSYGQTNVTSEPCCPPPGGSSESGESSSSEEVLADWVWVLIGFAVFNLLVLIAVIIVCGIRRDSPARIDFLAEKDTPNNDFNHTTVIPVAAPAQPQQSIRIVAQSTHQQQQPVILTPAPPAQQQQQQPVILTPAQQQQPVILTPAQQQQQPIMLNPAPQPQPIRIIQQPQPQPIILAPVHQPQPRPKPAVMTPYGPVPLLTNIPVVRRVNSHPNLYGHATPAGTLRRPIIEEIIDDDRGAIVDFPDYDRTMERDAYSDLEQNMRLNDEIDDIYGSFGRSAGRSRYGGGSMRSRGPHGQRRRSRSLVRAGSHRSSRRSSRGAYDVYEHPSGEFTVIEERIPASHFGY